MKSAHITENNDFHKEVENLQKLQHPNIIGLVDHWVHAGTLRIVMELADKGDLKGFINEYK